MTAAVKRDRRPLGRLNLRNPWHLLAVGCGAGLLPRAPGTWGSLVAVPLCLWLVGQSLPVSLALTAIMFALGWYAASVTERALGVHDHGCIVIDEVVGMMIAVQAYPKSWVGVALGFALFRVFDVLKPFPVSWADRRIPGGLGVMADDVLAGLYAWAAAQLLFCFAVCPDLF